MEITTEMVTIVGSILGAFFSTRAWDFYKSKQEAKIEQSKQKMSETHLYRDDLRKEVAKLRAELILSYEKREREISELQIQIIELTEQLAAFKVRVEFLEKENSDLKEIAASQAG